jgi:hypothetical protein
MNIREGTRRLALLVGVLGMVGGGVASYATLSDAIDARARYKAFERLANSDAVEQEREYLLSLHLSPDAVPSSTDFQGTRTSGALDTSTFKPLPSLPPGAILKPFSQSVGAAKAPDPYAPYGGSVAVNPPNGFVPLVPDSIASAASKDGIKSVLWSKNLEVQSIEKENGEVVISAQQPSLWTYFLVLLFPVAGFVIPWGAIRAVAWVGYGFAESPK